MKKYFALLAVAVMSIACGATEQESIEQKANRICEATINAIQQKDLKKTRELNEEFQSWINTLSAEDKATVEEIAKTHALKLL